MGNYFYYQTQYNNIIVNVNSFASTDKKLNYVIFRVEPDDDTDDDDDEFEKYINRYYR